VKVEQSIIERELGMIGQSVSNLIRILVFAQDLIPSDFVLLHTVVLRRMMNDLDFDRLELRW
jgi:hypothetical protein